MGFWGDLFGKSKKTDFGSIYPDPPQLRLDDYDLYLRQIDDIIGEYEGIKTGENMFDAVKFLYEPQKAELNRLFGIDTLPGDTFGAKGGTLQQLQAGLNQRGLLDSGTSGLLESQVYADRNRQLADLFGQAKQTQRNDYFNALTNLQQLFPERFEVRNIPNYLSYFNATNQYNVAGQRNAATEADRLMRAAQTQQALSTLFGGSQSIVGQLYGGNANSLNNRAGMFGGGGGGNNLLSGIDFSSIFGNNNQNPNLATFPNGNVYEGPGQIATSSGYGVRSMAQPYQAPKTNQQSSLVNSNTPGMGGGQDFSGLLMKLLAAGSTGGFSGIGMGGMF